MNRLNHFLLAGAVSASVFTAAARDRWTPEQANAWYARQPWLVGCNFGPSSAINQLEMWQAESWDPRTLDRELGWAEDLGFNSVRVYLHDLLWNQDRQYLVVTYWGGADRTSQFEVRAGETLLCSEDLYQRHPLTYFDEEYELPEALLAGRERLTVKFQAPPGQVAGPVFGLKVTSDPTRFPNYLTY